MEKMRLILVVFAFTLALAFYPDKASANKKEESYREIDVFFEDNHEMYDNDLRALTSSPIRKPEEVKNAIRKLEAMQNYLKSDYSKLQDCIAKAQAGNYIFIDLEMWKTPPEFTVSSLTNQEYYDKSTDAANYPTIEKTNYIRTVDVSTDYVKKEAPRRLKQIEKLLEKVEKWKAYYLGKGEKPTESAQSTDTANTDNKSQIESIYQKIDVFLGENREMYAKKLSDLVNSPTTNPEEIKKIIAELEAMERDLGSYYGKLQDYIAKVKSGNYILINLYRWPAFMPQLTATIITKDEYIGKASDAALNSAPEKTNFIITADASTEYIKKDGSNRLKEIEKLLEEVKDWKSYYLNQLAKPTAAVSGGSIVWRLKEAVVDPKKISGTSDNMAYIWKIDSAVYASAKNNYTASTKSITLTQPPVELKANDKFDITITLRCDKEGGGDCCVGLAMPFMAGCLGCTTAPGQDPFGTCENHATKTFISTCYVTGVDCDSMELSPIITGMSAPLATYVYKKKESSPQQPLTNTKPEVQQPVQPTFTEKSVESITAYLPMPSFEPDTDRPGLDYDSFELSVDDPKRCQNACAMDTECKAYTYVRPGVQGPKARCWLKTGVPSSFKNNCCISGAKP